MINLAIDMMGSDLGPEELAKACLQFINTYKDVNIYCFGRKEELSTLENKERIVIVDCPDVVPMECGAMQVLRMKNSSLIKAVNYTKDNSLDGVVSAGSSAGLITASTLYLKNVENVKRAGFCAPFFTAIKNKQVAILDIGASNINTGEELLGFAKLGSIYAKYILNEESPRVYTLCNGVEEGKGTDEIKEAYKLLKEEKSVNFRGNIEAREALNGDCDVVVTSGYPGNIFLKSTEGCASMMNAMIKKSFKRNIFCKIGYLLSKKGFDEMKETMNYRKTGGAILLGINAVVVKAHGNSNTYAFFYALDLAYRMAKVQIVEKIREEFKA